MWIHVCWELDWDQIILRGPWTSISCFTASSHFLPRCDSLSINQGRILQLRLIVIKMSDHNAEECLLSVWIKNTHCRPFHFFQTKICCYTHLIVNETVRNCVCSLFGDTTWDVPDPNDRVIWSIGYGTTGKTYVESWCVQGSAEAIAGKLGTTLITAL